MVQITQQALNNLNLHLSAETPQSQPYGYEEEMYRRKNEGEYDEGGSYPQDMYGQETYPESEYEDDEYESEDNLDYGRRNDDYEEDYRENISMSNFGYSPDIVGGDLINYDTPFSNNDFDDREILDNGGKPYGTWWNLENILGDVNVGKASSKNDLNDLMGFGVTNVGDIVGISNERVGQASFEDLFGFAGVNSKGTLGRADEFDPQTMFGIKDSIKSIGRGFANKVSTAVKDGKAKVEEKLEDIAQKVNWEYVDDEARRQAKAERKAEKEEIKEERREERESRRKEREQEKLDAQKEQAEREYNIRMKLAEKGETPESIRAKTEANKSSLTRGLGSYGGSRGFEIGMRDSSATSNIGQGDADIIGFGKMGGGEEGGMGGGNADVFGFESMRDNDIGETDTFGFREMSENSENVADNAESTFGFKLAPTQQDSEDVFGLKVAGDNPASFRDTFGFGGNGGLGGDTPQTMESVFGIHVTGAPSSVVSQPRREIRPKKSYKPEVRANLSTMQQSAPQKTIYKTHYKPNRKQRAPTIKQTFEYPVQQVQQQVPVEQNPQTQQGLYNRVGSVLASNQDYASNFQSYGYDLNVDNMFDGNDDNQLIGFNADVLGISALPSSRKVRVTSYTIEGGKVTKRSTKVNGKYVEKKKAKRKNSSKRKQTAKKQKVKKTNKQVKAEDDYFNKLIWG